MQNIIIKENDKLRERNVNLQEKLLAVVELFHHVLAQSDLLRENISRIEIAEYQKYLQIIEYMELVKKDTLSTHTIKKMVLPNIDHQCLETLLINLSAMHLVKLNPGLKFVEVTIEHPTVFQRQKNKNKTRDLKRDIRKQKNSIGENNGRQRIKK